MAIPIRFRATTSMRSLRALLSRPAPRLLSISRAVPSMAEVRVNSASRTTSPSMEMAGTSRRSSKPSTASSVVALPCSLTRRPISPSTAWIWILARTASTAVTTPVSTASDSSWFRSQTCKCTASYRQMSSSLTHQTASRMARLLSPGPGLTRWGTRRCICRFNSSQSKTRADNDV